jgi:hypothetical protein
MEISCAQLCGGSALLGGRTAEQLDDWLVALMKLCFNATELGAINQHADGRSIDLGAASCSFELPKLEVSAA